MCKVKGVFFDLYGTLIVYGDMRRAWSDWLDTLRDKLAEAGLELPKSGFAAACDGFFARDISQTGDDGLTVFERRIDRLCRELGREAERKHLRPAAEASLDAWHRYIKPDPSALTVLQTLREEYTLALVTNFDHPPHLHDYLPRLGLAGLFETIVISGEVGVRKPSPEIFEIALERTGLTAGQAVFVGDSYHDDVTGARSAGLRPILIARPGLVGGNDFTLGGQETEASDRSGIESTTISRLDQLPTILKEINR